MNAPYHQVIVSISYAAFYGSNDVSIVRISEKIFILAHIRYHKAYYPALFFGKGSGHGIWFIIGFLYDLVNLIDGFLRNLVVIAVNDI